MRKSILITGGAGFIGVNAAKRFASEGFSVTVFDNLSRRGTDINLTFLEKNFPAVRFVKGDIRTDSKLLAPLMEECDVVLHLAAQVAVTTSVTNPREDFDINALGTFNVLEAIRQSNKKPAIIYASTNKVYGGLETVPVVEKDRRYWFKDAGYIGVPETQPLDFHSPYGCSKGAADQYVRDYSRIYNLKTVVFRQSCIYGPHQLGIEDQGWVAWFLIAAMFGRPITLYGNGKQVRDLLFVEDLVDAYARAVANIDSVSGQVFNLGGGAENALSLNEFLDDTIQGKLGLTLNKSSADWRPGDQPIFVSDNSAYGKATGWKPATGSEKGIQRLFDWLTENKETLRQFYS